MGLQVLTKLLNENAILPTQGSAEAAGYDLYANIQIPVEIPPHSTVKIPTGIAIKLPNFTFGGLFARSGLATKEGLRPANCVGVIDSDYRGEVIVPLHNDNSYARIIKPEERIAQLVVIPYTPVEYKVVEELDTTIRGDGGFGSTGKE